jgi:hypothetical protein
MLRVSRELNDKSMSEWLAARCSDSGDDLDPRLMHRHEPLGLPLGILVWDGAEEIVAPAVLVDLARVSLGALINWTHLSMTS